MNEIYRRKLRYSEANRHYIRIEKKYRDMFPTAGETFIVVIGNQKFEVAVGSLNRIWTAIILGKTSTF